MRPLIDNIVAAMKKSGGRMEIDRFRELILKTRDSLFEDVDTLMELVIDLEYRLTLKEMR